MSGGDAVAKRTAQAVREDICELPGSLIMKRSVRLLFEQSPGGLCHVQQRAFRDSD